MRNGKGNGETGSKILRRWTYIWLKHNQVLLDIFTHVFLSPCLGQGKNNVLKYKSVKIITIKCKRGGRLRR